MKPITLYTSDHFDNDRMREAMEGRKIHEGYEITKTLTVKNLGWVRSHFRNIDLGHPTPIEIVRHTDENPKSDLYAYYLFVHLKIAGKEVLYGERFMDPGILQRFVTNARNLRGIRVKDFQKGYSYLNNMPDEERISLLTGERLRVNT